MICPKQFRSAKIHIEKEPLFFMPFKEEFDSTYGMKIFNCYGYVYNKADELTGSKLIRH